MAQSAPPPVPVSNHARRHAASALVCTTVGVLPSALFAGLAPLIRDDLDFGPGWIGIGVALFFATSSLSAVHGGRLAEALGSRRGLWLGVSISTLALLGIALLADSLPVLASMLALAGFGNAITQPAANLALAKGISARRRGLAFGFKQAAIPAAGALGGFAVPLLGLTLGWRTAFAGAAVLALLSASLPPPAVSARSSEGARPKLSPVPVSLWMLAGGIALGAAASNAMGAYLVESTIAGGWEPGVAGSLLGIGSMVGITARLGVGWLADRLTSGWLRVVAMMMLVGSLGFLALAFPGIPLLVAAGVVVAFAAGWGYNGLFLYAVVRLHPEAPASATGVSQLGAFGGPVIGPPLFGVLSATWSYAVAWGAIAVMSVLAAGLVQLARRRIAYERAT